MTKYSRNNRNKFVGMTLRDIQKFIIEIVMSSDNDILMIFWLPFAYESLDVNFLYFDMIISMIEKAHINDLDDDDCEKLQNMLRRHWRQIYVRDGVAKFFDFLQNS